MINPNLDGVTEAKIALQQYDAEMGKAVAGYVTAQTKSGSNEFHGSGFWFRRTDANQARDPFTQYQLVMAVTSRPPSGRSSAGRSADRSSRTSCSSSVIIKVSATAPVSPTSTAFLRRRCSRLAATEHLAILQPERVFERHGRRWRCGQPAQGQVFDPTTGNPLTGNGRTAFGNCKTSSVICNLIPNSLRSRCRREPSSRSSPYPTRPAAITAPSTITWPVARVPSPRMLSTSASDWVATSTLNVFGRYSQSYFSVSGEPGLGKAGGIGFGSGGLAGSSIIHNYSVSVGATKTLSQTWLADFRFGWFKYNPQTHKAFEGATPMNNINGTNMRPGLNITNQGAATALFTSGLPAFQGDGTLTNLGRRPERWPLQLPVGGKREPVPGSDQLDQDLGQSLVQVWC